MWPPPNPLRPACLPPAPSRRCCEDAKSRKLDHSIKRNGDRPGDGRLAFPDRAFQIVRMADAETCYTQALNLKPDYAVAHNNLAAALARDAKFGDSTGRAVNDAPPNRP